MVLLVCGTEALPPSGLVTWYGLEPGGCYGEGLAAWPYLELLSCDDARVLLVAANTPARMALGAVRDLREQGIAAGLLRPQTLWPYRPPFLPVKDVNASSAMRLIWPANDVKK